MIPLPQIDPKFAIRVPIIVTQWQGHPSIELRRQIHDIGLLKGVISCAIHEKPILVYPLFSDRFKSLASLIEKGVIYRDNSTGEYFYNI